VYAEVLLRRLLDAYRQAAGESQLPVKPATFTSAVAAGRSALTAASIGGDLRSLIIAAIQDEAGGQQPPCTDGHRRRLMTGDIA